MHIHTHTHLVCLSLIMLMGYSNLSPLAGTSVFNNIYSRFYERAQGHFHTGKSSLWSGRRVLRKIFFTTVHALGDITVGRD